jgi:hypothetical protein
VGGLEVEDLPGIDPRMGGAVAGPQDELAAEGFLDDGAEMLVGDEDDVVAFVAPDDVHGVAGGAAAVAFGLHLGGGVDVADDLGAGVAGLEFAQLVAGDHVGHGAAGAGVGQEDGLAGIQDGGGFGHEMHAAEHDDAGGDLGGLAGEFEGVAGEVGDVLHIGELVVVGEDDGAGAPP